MNTDNVEIGAVVQFEYPDFFLYGIVVEVGDTFIDYIPGLAHRDKDKDVTHLNEHYFEERLTLKGEL